MKASDERYTPQWILDLVRAFAPIAYDPCAPAHNPVGAASFSCLPEDGRLEDWKERARGGLVWVNPPFSRMKLWASSVLMAASAGAEVAMLTACDPSTGWFESLYLAADVAAFLRKRPKYDLPSGSYDTGAKQSAMLWYFGSRGWDFQRALRGHAYSHFPSQASRQ